MKMISPVRNITVIANDKLTAVIQKEIASNIFFFYFLHQTVLKNLQSMLAEKNYFA